MNDKKDDWSFSKTEKESEGAVGGPIPGFKGTKRTLGPAGAPVSKKTGKVFAGALGEGDVRLLRPKGKKKKKSD